ncbi:nucleoside-diphosphate sugar epimerase/dehydratase [Acidocella sp.]|uniref:nucleoside-diphosphate sugar epimerase/dehydratase n=1 Tax=Acidocella sp. TaxID=50710 RepID=UPI00260B3A01|nr:nucleoside-diphosphate sugar epimerase/dehydratase [Acidocella sp.]
MSRHDSTRLAVSTALNIVLDGAFAALAVVLSFWMANPGQPWPAPEVLPLGGALAIWLIGIPFGLSRLHWRFISFKDLAIIAAAAVVAAVMMILLMIGAGLSLPSPAFPVILAMVLLVLLTGPKLLYRLIRQKSAPFDTAQTALLAGSGDQAELFLAANAKAIPAYRVMGLMALSAKHVGRRVHGLDVIGAADNAAPALARLKQKPDLLIITAENLAGQTLASLLHAAEQHDIRVLRAPSLTKLAPADQKVELRPIAIEDLLNRQQVRLDREGLEKLVAGKRVMVTGAGGSIGGELARQLAGFAPAELFLLDSSEFAVWQIDVEIAELVPALSRRIIVADVRDAVRVQAIMRACRPELVFHAAALKHVPIVEANRLEGLRTNALGTQIVANAAAASGARLMVLISTDKAVNPSSVMGGSKRLAEMYCQALDVEARRQHGTMRCVTVRFGNVLGSTGSVVPLFRRQLAHGGPLTVTHPDMERYFMTVREAVGLILEASKVGIGDEAIPDGGIFVLDMGEPVKIIDLARQMIRLAGLQPDKDIAIRYTGLRPGEKLFEELFHGGEHPVPTTHDGLLMACPRLVDMKIVASAFEGLQQAAVSADEQAAMAILRRLVPEFSSPAGLAVSRTPG